MQTDFNIKMSFEVLMVSNFRAISEDILHRFNGKIEKENEDFVEASFMNAIDAATCAIELFKSFIKHKEIAILVQRDNETETFFKQRSGFYTTNEIFNDLNGIIPIEVKKDKSDLYKFDLSKKSSLRKRGKTSRTILLFVVAILTAFLFYYFQSNKSNIRREFEESASIESRS